MRTVRYLPVVVLGAALSVAGCAGPPRRTAEGAQPIAHLVLCWLKEPGDADHRRRVIERTETFRYMPGVLDLHVGPPLSSERTIVDDSFDVGVYLRFQSTRALQRYLSDPVHTSAVREVFAPLCEQIRVHDFYAP